VRNECVQYYGNRVYTGTNTNCIDYGKIVNDYGSIHHYHHHQIFVTLARLCYI
jgi:hypothetical protein